MEFDGEHCRWCLPGPLLNPFPTTTTSSSTPAATNITAPIATSTPTAADGGAVISPTPFATCSGGNASGYR